MTREKSEEDIIREMDMRAHQLQRALGQRTIVISHFQDSELYDCVYDGLGSRISPARARMSLPKFTENAGDLGVELLVGSMLENHGSGLVLGSPAQDNPDISRVIKAHVPSRNEPGKCYRLYFWSGTTNMRQFSQQLIEYMDAVAELGRKGAIASNYVGRVLILSEQETLLRRAGRLAPLQKSLSQLGEALVPVLIQNAASFRNEIGGYAADLWQQQFSIED